MPGNQFGEFAPQSQNPQQKMEVYSQSLANQHRVALNNTSSPQGMSSGTQGSPMAHPGLDGQEMMYAGNGPRTGMPPHGAPGAPQQGNHALQDYQMQLMLLEQQNKKRLLMARQEQDPPATHQQGGVGAPGFATAMSPQGSRAGPSPNPTDMKRGTPKLGQQDLPGSPMPNGVMQPQRGSPAPNMNFDPNQVPPGMPPQFFAQPQMTQGPMMRPPPSSHPGANFNNQQLTPQQIEAMRASQMQNGAWRGPPQPGMMPPPPAPTNEQPRPEPSPSQPNQAPPTPNQSNKANPKKKVTKDNKVYSRQVQNILSIVDIDSRSRPIKRVQTKVLLHLPTRTVTKLLHRHLPRQPPPSHPSISQFSIKTGSNSNSNSHRHSLYSRLLVNSSPWTPMARHLGPLVKVLM